MPGPYVINSISLLISLPGQPAVKPDSDKAFGVQCVGLVKYYSKAPRTADWVMGQLVKDCPNLRSGTAIATFVNGSYPSYPHGNHACFFIRFLPDDTGFTVLEQHVAPVKDRIQTRDIRYDDTREIMNNANKYSVIL